MRWRARRFTAGALGAAVLGLAGAAAARASSAAPTPLTWERAFPIDRGARDVHLDATFTGSDGRPHHLELWRHGRTFLHRRTDDALDLYVVAAHGHGHGHGDDATYRFFDHRRHVVTGVKRDNLYRIGVFSDWFGLAHVVDRPKTRFELRASADPLPPLPGAPRRDCTWRELVTGEAVTRVCWSARWATPLAITRRDASGAWTETFTTRTAEPAKFRRGEATIPSTPPAYSFIDADHEIAPHSAD